MHRARVLASVLVPVLAAAALACSGGGDPEQQAGPFRIGVMESLTGAGGTVRHRRQ